MDKIPKRSSLARIYRGVLDKYESSLFLPVKDPNFYQVISILLSGIFLARPDPAVGTVLIVVILVLDWMDGAVARRYKLVSRKGWMVDVVVDRISEGLMFVAYLGTGIGNTLFFLYLINIAASIYSVKTGKHLILPLRFVYLLYLAWVVLK